MQSFINLTLIFEDFVQNYSGYAALLHDTTHNNFSWDINTWNLCHVQLHARLGSDVMHHANILTHIVKSLDTNTCGDMYEWVKQLDDNLRYIGKKSS